jgi:hypothetical protein
MVIGLLAVYVLFVAPRLVGLFIDDIVAFILSQAAVAMVQIILFMIFFYFIIIPITYTLKEAQADQLQIFLAAPVKPSDVLLGEFLGQMPFYAIIVTVVAGFFTAVMAPIGLDIGQTAMIIVIFVLTFFSALWIGTVVAAILRTRLGKTARGKDIGKALSFIIALPMVAIMYAIMGGNLLQALADPAASGMIRTILGVLPSSWGAEVIVSFASNPGNIGSAGFETITRFSGLIAFFLAVLWLGTKAASRAYSLEATAFAGSKAKPDGLFYKTIGLLGGGRSFGALLVSMFKDYGRRLENLSKIFYMVGLLALINIFLLEPGDAEAMLLMPQFILPLLAAFVVGEVTLRGKEALFIYRKTPSGVQKFVKARLVHGWLIVIPVAAAITMASTVLMASAQNTVLNLLTVTGLVVLTVAADVAFVLGLSLLNPAFSDKSGNYLLNIMITMQVLPIGVFLAPLIIFGRIFHLGILQTLLYFTVPLSWATGITMLYLGERKLTRIE